MVSNASRSSETTVAKNTAEHLLQNNCSSDNNRSSSNKMPEQQNSSLATLPPPSPSPQPPPPPPPPFPPSSSSSSSSGQTRTLLVRPESAPPVGCSSSQRGIGSRGPADSSSVQLPQQRIPLPKAPMKRFQWTKIPTSVIASSPGNIWTQVADTCGGYQINFQRMEELFSSVGGGGGGRGAHSANAGNASRAGDVSTVDGNSPYFEKKTKRTDEINLIDGKRSMIVNVFLRQFRMTNFDIISCLRLGESSKMGPERLRTLLKILPEPEDVQLLLNFDGDRSLLGSAEKFYMELISLPNYGYLIEALLAKEEFPPAIGYIRPAIEAIFLSARDIKDCKALHEIMYAVVMAGNFLNSGVYSGNAVGFQLDSLLKLSDLRSNKPRMTLLHFVAQETEAKNPQLIEQLKELKHLSEASQYSVDFLTSEIATLRSRVQTISSRMSDCDSKFQEQMKLFLEEANSDLESLDFDAKELEKLRSGLASFFCEDAQTFKLDDCISIFNSFCRMFLKAVEENKERHQQNERTEERRRLREEQLATKRMALTSKESAMTTANSPDAVGQSAYDVVDHGRTSAADRRIHISQTMPSFLLESNHQCNSIPDENQKPGRLPHQRHRNRNNSESAEGGRRTLPPTPTNGVDHDPSGQNELLLNALLKAADEAPDRRSRRRSRSRSGIVDHRGGGVGRERSVSPVSSLADPSVDAISRDQPGRSSCPSRLSGGQGKAVRDSLLTHRQLSGRDSAAAEESDAEINAKQERESRRMERRRRSQLCSDESSSALASASPRKTYQEMVPILSSNHSETPAKNQPNRTIDNDAGEKKTESKKPEVARLHHNGGSGASLSSTDALIEDLISRPGNQTRRDAANIRSLVPEQGLSSSAAAADTRQGSAAETVSTQPLNGRKQSLSGGEVDRLAAEEVPLVSASSKSRLSGLVKQHNIPVHRITVASKKRNPGQDPGGGVQKDCVGQQKKSRSQSDYRLKTRSRDNLSRESHKTREISKSSDVGTSIPVERTILNCIKTDEKDSEVTVDETSSQEQSSDSDNDCQNGVHSKLFGEQSKPPCSENQPASTGEDGTNCDENETGRRAVVPGPLAMPLKSVAVTDYGEMGRRATTASERASSRKEKLKKLSQIYSDDQASDSSAVNNGRKPFPHEEEPPPAEPGDNRRHPPLFDPYDATARDEGVDVEGTGSLPSSSSASQRTSMSSTVDSDLRVTPLMDRKEYANDDGGEGERKVDASKRRPRRSPAVPSAARTSKEIREVGAGVATKKTGVLPRISTAEVKGRTASGGGGGAQLKTISAPKPKSSASSAVRYRIAKPNLVAYSTTPSSGSRGDKDTDKPKSDAASGTRRDLSLTLKISPMSVKSAKTDHPKPRPASTTVKRPSSAVTVGTAPPLSSSRQTPKTATERKTPTDFVRAAGGRATLPARVLVESKRAAVEKSRTTARIGQISNSPTLPLPRKLPSLPPATSNLPPSVETSRLSPLNCSAFVVRDPKKQANAESSARNVKSERTPTLNAGYDKTAKVSSLGKVANSKPNSRSMSPSTTTSKASHVTIQRKDSSNVTIVVRSTS